MPELPEVETVKETLKKQVLNDTILEVEVNWDNIIEFPTVEEFKKQIKNQKINDIKSKIIMNSNFGNINIFCF